MRKKHVNFAHGDFTVHRTQGNSGCKKTQQDGGCYDVGCVFHFWKITPSFILIAAFLHQKKKKKKKKER
jgi:hypothetical protein